MKDSSPGTLLLLTLILTADALIAKPAFMFFKRHGFTFHICNFDIPVILQFVDEAADQKAFSLHFHFHCSVVLVPDPSCSSQLVCHHGGAIAKSHSLHMSMKNNVSANHKSTSFCNHVRIISRKCGFVYPDVFYAVKCIKKGGFDIVFERDINYNRKHGFSAPG